MICGDCYEDGEGLRRLRTKEDDEYYTRNVCAECRHRHRMGAKPRRVGLERKCIGQRIRYEIERLNAGV